MLSQYVTIKIVTEMRKRRPPLRLGLLQSFDHLHYELIGLRARSCPGSCRWTDRACASATPRFLAGDWLCTRERLPRADCTVGHAACLLSEQQAPPR